MALGGMLLALPAFLPLGSKGKSPHYFREPVNTDFPPLNRSELVYTVKRAMGKLQALAVPVYMLR
jgi:hypothetical protein